MVKTNYARSREQLANIFIKALGRVQHYYLLSKFGMIGIFQDIGLRGRVEWQVVILSLWIRLTLFVSIKCIVMIFYFYFFRIWLARLRISRDWACNLSKVFLIYKQMISVIINRTFQFSSPLIHLGFSLHSVCSYSPTSSRIFTKLWLITLFIVLKIVHSMIMIMGCSLKRWYDCGIYHTCTTP